MKPQSRAFFAQKNKHGSTVLFTCTHIIILQLFFQLSTWAGTPVCKPIQDSVKIEMEKQLNDPKLLKELNYPNTVKRFYQHRANESSWLVPDQHMGRTASAMLLLDCVRQYGLFRENYHPTALTYEKMHDALSKNPVAAIQKAKFDIMLTDAMLSMINHLHFGAYNPYLSKTVIDGGVPNRLKAEMFLGQAINSPNLMDTILTVQPKIEQYRLLQGYMKLIAGQYTCDSHEVPDQEVLTLMMNLERLRWIPAAYATYLHINIPSFKLTYHGPDSMYTFKVIVGKVSAPTPTLQSQINYIETAPDWNIPNKIFRRELLPRAYQNHLYFEDNHMAVYDQKENFVAINATSLAEIKKHPKRFHAKQTPGCDNALGKVVFRFNNDHDIYLHDTPEQQYFSRSKRAMSHGCIRVENAGFLATLLLKHDGQADQVPLLEAAMAKYSKRKFTFKTAPPILVTYLTATVEDGLLAYHEDIYQLDQALGASMYKNNQLANKNNGQ